MHDDVYGLHSTSMIWILTLLGILILILFTALYVSKQLKPPAITSCLSLPMPPSLQIKLFFFVLRISDRNKGSKGISTKQLCKTV